MAIENKNTIVEVEDDSLYTLSLKKPIVYNEKEYSELTFDFEKLTGNDALNIEDELNAVGKMAIVPVFSGEYLIRMAAKACTEPVGADFFKLLPIRDYNRIRSHARSFLLKSE